MATKNLEEGGAVVTAATAPKEPYEPNRGVLLGQILGKQRGDAFGLYHGTIEPGCEIAREIHPETSETVYIISGEAVGLVGDKEVPLRAGQVLHVHANVHHGLRNVGTGTLEFLVIGNPDF